MLVQSLQLLLNFTRVVTTCGHKVALHSHVTVLKIGIWVNEESGGVCQCYRSSIHSDSKHTQRSDLWGAVSVSTDLIPSAKHYNSQPTAIIPHSTHCFFLTPFDPDKSDPYQIIYIFNFLKYARKYIREVGPHKWVEHLEEKSDNLPALKTTSSSEHKS